MQSAAHISQDELSGTPLVHLTVFEPARAFADKTIPPVIQSVLQATQFGLIHSSTQDLFLRFVRLLGGPPRSFRDWGVAGRATEVFFPMLFGSREDSMRETSTLVVLNRQLGHIGRGADTIRVIQALKKRGNILLEQGNLAEAAFVYTVGAAKLESAGVDEADISIRTLVAQCLSNLALVQTKLGQLDLAIHHCTSAIVLLPSWEKPYYRRGKCFEEQGNQVGALSDYQRALQMCPSSKEFQCVVKKVHLLIKE